MAGWGGWGERVQIGWDNVMFWCIYLAPWYGLTALLMARCFSAVFFVALWHACYRACREREREGMATVPLWRMQPLLLCLQSLSTTLLGGIDPSGDACVSCVRSYSSDEGRTVLHRASPFRLIFSCVALVLFSCLVSTEFYFVVVFWPRMCTCGIVGICFSDSGSTGCGLGNFCRVLPAACDGGCLRWITEACREEYSSCIVCHRASVFSLPTIVVARSDIVIFFRQFRCCCCFCCCRRRFCCYCY